MDDVTEKSGAIQKGPDDMPKLSPTTERQVAEKYVIIRRRLDDAKAEASRLESELAAQIKFMSDYFTDRNLKTLAFSDLGRITMKAPTPRAKFGKENQPSVFEFVTLNGGADCIKPTIHSSTFSSFIRELIEKGINIPAIIEVYYQPTFNYTPA